MLKALTKIVKRHAKLLAIGSIVLTVCIAYGQTTQMYFWQDDSALIFKLQHPQGEAGSFGAGVIGNGPYKYLVTFFVPFFPLFGLNPSGYFLIGFLSDFLVVGMFYLFSSELLHDKRGGFFATLFMAAGYIGSDIMFRIINSWQTNIGLVLAIASFWLLVKHINSKKLRFYFLSLACFLAAVEFVYIRSHSLVIAVLGIDLFLLPSLSFLPRLILRQIPYWSIFYLWYLKGGSVGSQGLGSFISALIHGKFYVVSAFLGTIGEDLVPNIVQNLLLAKFPSRENLILFLASCLVLLIVLRLLRSSKKIIFLSLFGLLLGYVFNRYLIHQNLYWYRDVADTFAGGIGIYASIGVIFISLAVWKKCNLLARGLLIGYIILTSQIFGYFIQYPTAIFNTTHRYLSYSLIGYSFVLGSICFLLFRVGFSKKSVAGMVLGIGPVAILLFSNLFLGFTYQHQILRGRSYPTARFYQVLKESVPRIQKGAAFYFDVENNPEVQKQFDDFFSVGSMPESTALAVYYGVDRYDVKMLTNFDEMISLINKGELNLNQIYTFFYGTNGLIDTTRQTRQLLKLGNGSSVLSVLMGQGSRQVTLQGGSVYPFDPMLLKLHMEVDQQLTNGSSSEDSPADSSLDDKSAMIDYLKSRRDYYGSVKVSSLSQWKYQEIGYIADDNLNTSWRGHRIYWGDHRHEEVMLDLGQSKNIDRLVWFNWNHTLTPTEYSIQTSVDGSNWETVKSVHSGERADGEMVIDSFPDTLARYVKMVITKTLSDDAPAIEEIEVVESKFKNVDINQALQLKRDPMSMLSNQEAAVLLPRLAPFLNLKVIVKTDKEEKSYPVPIGELNGLEEISTVLNPGGTKIESIKLDVSDMPLKISVDSAQLTGLSFEEVKNLGLIKIFSEN